MCKNIKMFLLTREVLLLYRRNSITPEFNHHDINQSFHRSRHNVVIFFLKHIDLEKSVHRHLYMTTKS